MLFLAFLIGRSPYIDCIEFWHSALGSSRQLGGPMYADAVVHALTYIDLISPFTTKYTLFLLIIVHLRLTIYKYLTFDRRI